MCGMKLLIPFSNFNGAAIEIWEITYPVSKIQQCNRWNLGMDKKF